MDDRESAVWLLFRVSLRSTEHNLSPGELVKRLKMFGEADRLNDELLGGELKAYMTREARLSRSSI